MSPFHRDARAGRRSIALAVITLLSASASPLAAQAWFYPSFQQPRTVEREYNFAVVAAGGADFLFQWREGVAPGTQLSVDAGLADPTGPSNTKLLIAGQIAHELTRATAQQPLDLLFTAGAGLAAGNGPGLLRFPIGVSVGHRFPLEGGMAVTPYVHPRVSIDVWTGSHVGDRSTLSLDFDLGGSLEITPEMSLRASIIVSGNDAATSTGVGFGLAITPPGVRRR
jgi:hypothetical protein